MHSPQQVALARPGSHGEWRVLVALLVATVLGPVCHAADSKPKVWIISDASDPTLPGPNKHGTLNDPDDVSAMASYLLLANEFDTIGIVVASTHRHPHQHTPDQGSWANRLFGSAYKHDVVNLNRQIGGYPTDIVFKQSCIKQTGERFAESKDYRSLDGRPSVRDLREAISKVPTGETLNVLCWGPLTEPAMLLAHCQQTDRLDLCERFRIIAHWTDSSLHQGSPANPADVANCREDSAACAFLKRLASSGTVAYHECGAIGQHGIVSGGPKGTEYFDQFRSSRLGRLFVNGSYVHRGVDHSDSATFWVLLGEWGVSLGDLPSDGSNNPTRERRNERAFSDASARIHDELLRRSRAAAMTPHSDGAQ